MCPSLSYRLCAHEASAAGLIVPSHADDALFFSYGFQDTFFVFSFQKLDYNMSYCETL